MISLLSVFLFDSFFWHEGAAGSSAVSELLHALVSQHERRNSDVQGELQLLTLKKSDSKTSVWTLSSLKHTQT